jgi:hypothetical protein
LWWTIPTDISSGEVDTLLPAIAVDSMGDVQVVWDDSVQVSYRRLEAVSSEWSAISTIASHTGGIADADTSSTGQREGHVVWAQHVGGDDWDIFHRRQVLEMPYGVYLPFAVSD